MPRKRLAVGELGEIKTSRIANRKYQARARVRTINGDVVQVKGTGDTAETARDQLRLNARRRAYSGGEGAIDARTTVGELAQRTLDHLRSLPSTESGVRPQTLDQYDTVMPIIRGERPGYPGIGGLMLGDIESPDPIHGWLYAVSKVSPSTGKRCKAVMSRSFALAMRRGVRPWGDTNPAKNADLYAREKKETVAPSITEIKGVRAAARAWQTPMKRTNLVGILDLIAATGARPNEILALRWDDVDLLSDAPSLTIAGTLVELKGKAKDGGGIRRQSVPKSDAGYRKLTLPSWAATTLMEMRVMALNEKVFPNEKGGWLSERNIATRFRDARGDAFAHVTLYSYRRAVATLIADALGVEKAARQLGHESPAITQRHYVKRAEDAGDFTEVLDRLAP